MRTTYRVGTFANVKGTANTYQITAVSKNGLVLAIDGLNQYYLYEEVQPVAVSRTAQYLLHDLIEAAKPSHTELVRKSILHMAWMRAQAIIAGDYVHS